MDNRFGVKDLVLFVLLLLLAGMVALAMVQYDRQWTTLRQMNEKIDDQGRDLVAIRQQVSRGLTVTSAISATEGAAPTIAGDDPSARVRAATTMPGYAAADWYVASAPSSDKLTPLVSGDAFAASIQGRVFETLASRDPVTLEYVAHLALPGWTVEDHIADYRRYVDPKVAAGAKEDDVSRDAACPCPMRVTFHIRPGVTFSDGVPMTADDVVWTYNWTMNPDVDAARARSGLDKVRRVIRSGPDAVTFEFAQPYYDPIGLTGDSLVLPRHYYEPLGPKAFNTSTGLLLGTGRYKFESTPTTDHQWTPGTTVELVRNDRYWGVPASLAKLVYRVIVQDQVRLTAFTNGEIDTFPATPQQWRALLGNADVMTRCNHLEYETVSSAYRYIAWNQERNGKPTVFADRRVRQAMTMLCDRKRVCDDVLLGQASVATGPFSRLSDQCDPAIQPWPFDVSRARALLIEAGFKDDGTGHLLKPDGSPFEVDVTYPLGSPVVDRTMLVFKDDFAKAGVTFVPKRLDWSVFSETMKSRDFDAISLAWTSGPETDIHQMFDSSQMADRGDNFMSYRNAELDGLIRKAEQTLDPALRLALWRRCHAILNEDQPYTFLLTAKSLTFIDKRLHNVQVVKLYPGLNEVSEWYVPVGQQKWVH
jgi:peptide/nickel transport system substrate-binding protein